MDSPDDKELNRLLVEMQKLNKFAAKYAEWREGKDALREKVKHIDQMDSKSVFDLKFELEAYEREIGQFEVELENLFSDDDGWLNRLCRCVEGLMSKKAAERYLRPHLDEIREDFALSSSVSGESGIRSLKYTCRVLVSYLSTCWCCGVDVVSKLKLSRLFHR